MWYESKGPAGNITARTTCHFLFQWRYQNTIKKYK